MKKVSLLLATGLILVFVTALISCSKELDENTIVTPQTVSKSSSSNDLIVKNLKSVTSEEPLVINKDWIIKGLEEGDEEFVFRIPEGSQLTLTNSLNQKDILKSGAYILDCSCRIYMESFTKCTRYIRYPGYPDPYVEVFCHSDECSQCKRTVLYFEP